jgi:Holliday junction DNA helicase RuvA
VISTLEGKLAAKPEPGVILVTAAGIGYEVHVPMALWLSGGRRPVLAHIGRDVFLHIHQVVREDSQAFYGFQHVSERRMFRALIKIDGIGPRNALRVMSAVEPAVLEKLVSSGDVATLTRIPGIGTKTAERLAAHMAATHKDLTSSPDQSCQDQAHVALVATGLNEKDAEMAIRAVASGKEKDARDLFKRAMHHVIFGERRQRPVKAAEKAGAKAAALVRVPAETSRVVGPSPDPTPPLVTRTAEKPTTGPVVGKKGQAQPPVTNKPLTFRERFMSGKD